MNYVILHNQAVMDISRSYNTLERQHFTAKKRISFGMAITEGQSKDSCHISFISSMKNGKNEILETLVSE